MSNVEISDTVMLEMALARLRDHGNEIESTEDNIVIDVDSGLLEYVRSSADCRFDPDTPILTAAQQALIQKARTTKKA